MWTTERWLSVVLIGVAVHLVAAYLKPRLDRFSSRTALWWTTRTDKRSADREARLHELKDSSERRLQARLAALGFRIGGVQSMMFAAFSFFMFTVRSGFPRSVLFPASILLAVLFLLSALAALSEFWKAARMEGEVERRCVL